MPRTWTHVGRCWTNGEPFLALDADLLPHWRGTSPAVLAAALAHPTGQDDRGEPVELPSGRLALVSAALDGTGPDGASLSIESPGPLPTSADYDARTDDEGAPLLEVGPRTYRLSICWMVEVDGEAAFARWLLTNP